MTCEKFKANKLHKDVLEEIASKIKLLDGCKELFEELHRRNIKIHIVSGSILLIIQRVLKEHTWLVDSIKANDFMFSSAGFLIEIFGTKYDFEGKAAYISEVADSLNISPADILFVGNSYNDKHAYKSGASTLCINPIKTDPSDTVVWHNRIDDCTNLMQLLSSIA